MSTLSQLRGQFSNRWRALGALAALVAVLIILAIALTNGGSDDGAVSTQAPTAEAAAPTPATEADPTSAPTARPQPTTPDETLEQPSPTPEPTVVMPLMDCLRTGDTGESESELATESIRIALTDADDGRCFAQDLADLRGDVYWLPLRDEQGSSGGALALQTADGDFDVVLLGLGPWNSYRQIGGNEGRDAPAIAGLPTGNIIAERGGYTVEVSGAVYLFGESETSTFYWLTEPIFDSWVVNGAETSLLGSPTSSVYAYEGADRVDFNGGFITHIPGETPAINSISLDRVFLPPNADMRGRLITARDGTAWFIDDRDRRWWVPNVQTWFCAGGTANRVAEDQPGYAIHRLTLGGVAPGPLGATGTNPDAGGVEVQRFCEVQLGPFANAVEADAGWACALDTSTIDVTHDELCTWQYGDTATAGNEENPFDWTCNS